MQIRFKNIVLFSIISLLSVIIYQKSYAQCEFNNAPLGEICTTAEYICGSKLDGYIGRLRTKNITEVFWNNPASNPKAGVCGNAGQFDNTSWFSFTACSKTVHLRIHYYNCVHPLNNLSETGIQTGLFSECRKSSSVACQDEVGSTSGTIDLSYNNFIPGQLVYFVLDGYASSVCDFRIEVIEGLDITPVIPPDASSLQPGYITGPVEVSCENKFTPVTYSLLEPERAVNFSNSCAPPPSFNPIDSVCYGWSVFPSKGRYFDNQDSTGKSVQIVFTEPGTYTIHADTYFNPFYVGSCANAASGTIKSWTVTVLPENVIVAAPVFVCPGDTRYFCGQLITGDTTIVCDDDPCNIVRQKFVFGVSKTEDLGTQYICKGSGFLFQGINYTNAGSYSVTDDKDCSLVHNFIVEVLDIRVNINSTVQTLNCLNPNITLNSLVDNVPAGSRLDYIWNDANNKVVGNDKFLTVSEAGDYILSVYVITPSGTCSATQRITVKADFSKPEIIANVPVVRCAFPNERPAINVSSVNGYSVAEWTTPFGKQIHSLSIFVDSLNAITGNPYRLKLTGMNGCTLDTSFVLKTNFEKPDIVLTGDDLTCSNPAIWVEAKTNISVDSIRWNKIAPDQKFYGSYLTKLSHEVKEPGMYRVDAMASVSKCWNSQTIAIQDKMIYPDFTFDNNLKWHCNTQSIDILTRTSETDIEYKWTTNDGKILSDLTSKDMVAGSPGIYRLTGQNPDNGCVKIEDLIIEKELNQPSSVNAITKDVLCHGEYNGQLTIQNVNGGFSPYTYYLNDKPISQLSLNDLPSGVYDLEIRDKYDCVLKEQYTIAEPLVFEISTDEDIQITFNESAILSFTSNYADDDIVSVVWTDELGNVLGYDFDLTLLTATPKVIYLSATTENGCNAHAEIRVKVDNELKVYFPNIFSPNNDGINDRLVIYKNKIPATIHKIAIYDRLGNLVFTDDSQEFNADFDGWDGTFRGNYVLPGVYIMTIDLTDYFGKRQILKQDLTVIR